MNPISAEELAVYDRQIRVWGMEAQKRMREARVLIVGLTGLATEVVKNIVLAGVGAVTILDQDKVMKRDLASQFFVGEEDLGHPKLERALPNIRLLNPHVVVTGDTGRLEDKDEAFFSSFDLVCLTGCSLKQQLWVDGLCQKSPRNTKFVAGEVLGLIGYFVSDMREHTYLKQVEAQPGSDQKAQESTRLSISFPSLEKIQATKWSRILQQAGKRQAKACRLYFAVQTLHAARSVASDHELKDAGEFTQLLHKVKANLVKEQQVKDEDVPDALLEDLGRAWNYETAPVVAVLGGFLAQEILKAVSLKDEPHKNVIVFNARERDVTVLDIS